MPARPAANEAALRDAFLPIRDPHERLSLIAEACAGCGLPEEIRASIEPVPGCVSKVWLRMEWIPGPTPPLADPSSQSQQGQPPAAAVLRLQWDAGSPLVRGLAGLICSVFQGATARETATHRSSILTDLGLDRQLSPTRLRGLAAVESMIRQAATGTGPANTAE